jgi:hypothetical protein
VFRQRCPQSDRSEPARLGVTWADALVHLCEASLDHLEPGPRRRPAHRNQIVYHVEVGTLAANPHLGPLLPDPIRRYLTCDADARLVLEQLGVPVALSSRRATVDSRLRTLIEQRDRGCRVPGCTQSRWLHIHHIVHREDQGPTDVTNLCCLCPHHHRAHHLGVLGIHGDPTTPHGLVFSDHHGRVLTPNAQPLPPDAPIDEAARQLGQRDVHFEHPTGERLTAHSIWWSDRRRRPPPSEAA